MKREQEDKSVLSKIEDIKLEVKRLENENYDLKHGNKRILESISAYILLDDETTPNQVFRLCEYIDELEEIIRKTCKVLSGYISRKDGNIAGMAYELTLCVEDLQKKVKILKTNKK